MKYSDKDLFQLVADVESEFAALLSKAESQTEIADAEVVADGYSKSEIEELENIYSSMTKAEAEIHYNTLKKSLFGLESEEVEKAEEEAKSEPLEKTESLEKSEKETLVAQNEQLAKENEELKKSLEEVKTYIQDFVAKQAPQRKAITDIEVLRKTEEVKPALTKNEIDLKLKSKIRDLTLSKKDREIINNYYLDNGSVESIKHLL